MPAILKILLNFEKMHCYFSSHALSLKNAIESLWQMELIFMFSNTMLAFVLSQRLRRTRSQKKWANNLFHRACPTFALPCFLIRN